MSKLNGRQSGPEFPCASLNDALEHLRRPPIPAGVRFKLQHTYRDRGQVVAYVDARLVFDRLDRVCGQHWHATFDELPERLLPRPVDRNGQVIARPPLFARCRLTCFYVTREDVGEGEDPKAAFSDAIKRAAVQFGIGRVLYATRAVWLRAGEEDGQLRSNSKDRLIIDQRTEDWLRQQYGRWLEHRGIEMFGEPLAHDDDSVAPVLPADRVEGAGDREEAEPANGDGPSVSTVELERKRIGHWARTGAYSAKAVCGLCSLLAEADDVDALDRPGARKVAMALEFAGRGEVSNATLLAKLAELSKLVQRDEAATQLSEWLVRAANEGELTPGSRRKAA